MGAYFFTVVLPVDRLANVLADRVELSPAGDLMFWSDTRLADAERVPRDPRQISICFVAGSWRAFCTASMLDGSALAVDSVPPWRD